MGFLKVLRLRHLAILWLSQVLSAVGDRFYAIAVIWIAVKLTSSPRLKPGDSHPHG